MLRQKFSSIDLRGKEFVALVASRRAPALDILSRLIHSFELTTRLNLTAMATSGSINLKPNKPDSYDGRRDYLVVNTWLYKVEQYLALTQITRPGVMLDDSSRILFASTFLTGTAAVWWYTLIQSNKIPNTWEQFKAAVVKEFVPEDHVRRARDKLR